MAKKRVIFKLIFSEDSFCLSRNFSLQKVGNVEWLFDRLNFQSISSHIEELIVLNASKNNKEDPLPYKLKKSIALLMRHNFIPLTIGGGLSNLNQIDECFDLGADKILMNSSLRNNPKIVNKCANKYGSQSVSIGIDFKFIKKLNNIKKKYYSFTDNGNFLFLPIEKHIELLNNINFGELILTSIDKDGTGFGFDKKIMKYIDKNSKFPILLLGDAGKPEHFENLIKDKNISALVTGNLYNFLGNGLEILRNKIISRGVKLRIL